MKGGKEMFRIRWKNSRGVTEGLSSYPTEEAAGRQVAIWQQVFWENKYYIMSI